MGLVFITNKMLQQDTGKFRKNIKDQYFTRASTAQNCIDKIKNIYNHPELY